MPGLQMAAKAKNKKALNATDIAHKAERWSRFTRDAIALERERDQDEDLIAAQQRVDELAAVHDKKIEAAQARADALEAEILAWFEKRAKSVKVESRHAVAELVVGTKLGNRQIDAKKLTALCKKKGVDVGSVISIMVQRCDDLLGKKEVDAISTRDSVPARTASVKLKD